MIILTPQKQAEALHEQREWLRVTLSSIGDAVITTDLNGGVTFLNPVAQSLTGWTQEDAAGKPLDIVFKIVNEDTRQTVENPATKALQNGGVVRLANHTLLIAKDGTERSISDSAAPITNDKGEVGGVVLVFRDITERRKTERALDKALAHADKRGTPYVILIGAAERNSRQLTIRDMRAGTQFSCLMDDLSSLSDKLKADS